MESKSVSNPGWRAGLTWGALCALTLLSEQSVVWWETIKWIDQHQSAAPRGFLLSSIGQLLPMVLIVGVQALLGSHVARLMAVRKRSTVALAMYAGASVWLVFKACVIGIAALALRRYGSLPDGMSYTEILSGMLLNSRLMTVILFFSFSYAMCLQLEKKP